MIRTVPVEHWHDAPQRHANAKREPALLAHVQHHAGIVVQM
jgi:hypothetical protein